MILFEKEERCIIIPDEGCLLKVDQDSKSKSHLRHIADALTSQANELKTRLSVRLGCQAEPTISEREKFTKFLVDDPLLWHEFRLALVDAKVVTNFGVDQLLDKFILERRSNIEERIDSVDKRLSRNSEPNIERKIEPVAKLLQDRRKNRASFISDNILTKSLKFS